MTNGGGKSGSAGVAVKPTNKAEQSAAELVEPRAEAKGNAGQQSTLRTQSRGSVSQALERIRQVANQGGRRTWGGWGYMEGLRGRPRRQYRGFACTGPSGSVSGTAVTARLHSQVGRQTTPARDRCAGG